MKRLSVLIYLLIITIVLHSQQIEMEVDDTYLNIGEWGSLQITASGDIKNITYDQIDGINLKQTGRSSNYSSVNGKTTRNNIYTFQFQILKEGNINLPIFSATNSNGDVVKTQPVKVYVTRLEDSTDIEQDLDQNFETEYVKLYIDLPDRNLYAGEAIPVTVTAYFSTRFQPGLERAPYINSGSFLLDTGEQKASNKEKIIDGEQWIELTWDSFLTPLKAGDLNLEIMLDSYIVTGSGSGFFSNSKREELTTTTNPETVSIKQLPLEGRPDNFSGAIGDFNIDSALDRIEMSVGDPITLTIDLYGYGNFQRISEPVIQSDEFMWKLYNVSSSYNGANGSNYRGVKTFQQILSPNSEQLETSPIFSISYFNPIIESYVELTTKSFPIKVNPGVIVEQSSIKTTLDFDSKKEFLKHKHSGNYYNFESSPVTFILYVITILLIITTIVLKLILHYKTKQGKNLIKRSYLFKQLKELESNKNYYDALLKLKEFVVQESNDLTNINSSALTSEDLDLGCLKEIITVLEEIKYMKRSITEDEYQSIKSKVIQEFTK